MSRAQYTAHIAVQTVEITGIEEMRLSQLIPADVSKVGEAWRRRFVQGAGDVALSRVLATAPTAG